MGLRKRVKFVGIFWGSARDVFVDHVVCVGNCVVCGVVVFVVGGWVVEWVGGLVGWMFVGLLFLW